jgi:hypothetical protein
VPGGRIEQRALLHLRLLPGLVDKYRALVDRAFAS